MDFIFTTAVTAGANVYQFETSSGQITADMSECDNFWKWEEMVKTEAVSAELDLHIGSSESYRDVADYFTTEYMTVQG